MSAFMLSILLDAITSFERRFRASYQCIFCEVLLFFILAYFAVVNLTMIDLPGLTKIAVGKCILVYIGSYLVE